MQGGGGMGRARLDRTEGRVYVTRAERVEDLLVWQHNCIAAWPRGRAAVEQHSHQLWSRFVIQDSVDASIVIRKPVTADRARAFRHDTEIARKTHTSERGGAASYSLGARL